MLNGKLHRIIRGNEARVLCNAIVDLISRHQRPYLFRVTVTGLPPHIATREYTIAAKDDNAAAMKGLSLFVKEFENMPRAIQAAEAT
jgi:hypothetical protein